MSLSLSKFSLILGMTVGLLITASCGGAPSPESASNNSAPAQSTEPAASTVILDGVMWTAKDNGEDIDWNNSSAYCDELTLDGFEDWGLATVAQLEALYAPEESYMPEGGGSPVHVKNPIQLTSDSVWSSERSGTGSAWYFFFARGYRNSLQLINATNGRVLCVRVP